MRFFFIVILSIVLLIFLIGWKIASAGIEIKQSFKDGTAEKHYYPKFKPIEKKHLPNSFK